MTLAPREQRALLKIERSLRADPVLRAALRAFNCQFRRGARPARENLSPWHPVLWRAALVALVTVSLSFAAIVAVLASEAL